MAARADSLLPASSSASSALSAREVRPVHGNLEGRKVVFVAPQRAPPNLMTEAFHHKYPSEMQKQQAESFYYDVTASPVRASDDHTLSPLAQETRTLLEQKKGKGLKKVYLIVRVNEKGPEAIEQVRAQLVSNGLKVTVKEPEFLKEMERTSKKIDIQVKEEAGQKPQVDFVPRPLPVGATTPTIQKTQSRAALFFKSPIGLPLLLILGGIIVGIVLPFHFHQPLIAAYFGGGILLIGVGVKCFFSIKPYAIPKCLLYEGTIFRLLVSDIFAQRFSSFSPKKWWHPITDDGLLLLGALPLKNKEHGKKLKEAGIKNVVSVTEDFELTTSTWMSEPVSPEDWEDLGISQYRVNCVDLHPVELSEIDKAVEFIHEKIQKKEKVYVHCKAGRGRSATVVIAYLMKYGKLSRDAAIEKVKEKRLVSIKTKQKLTLDRYYNQYVAPKK